MNENQQKQRKKLNIKAAPFDAVVQEPLVSNQQCQEKIIQDPQQKKKKVHQKILQDLKDEYVVSKQEVKEMKDLINLEQFNKKKTQKKPTEQIKNDSDSEDELKFDPKYGYWHYMHNDYLKLLNKKKLKLEKKAAQQAENERLEQQKRLDQLQKRKKKFERHLRLTRTLGIKHIGTIIHNLKLQRGQAYQKLKRNETKIKKPSKIKLTQRVYSENFGQDISKVIESQQDQESEYITEEEKETKPEKNTFNVAETIHRLQIENLYSLETYNNMKIRGWVNHILSPELDAKALSLINALAATQAQKKIQDPKKFKKRIVAGFHESKRTLTTILEVKQSKLIILAVNNLENPLPDGTDFQILQIIKLCINNKIPFINVSSRKKLGWAFRGKLGAKISVISIINYQGYNEEFQELIENLHSLSQQFQKKFSFELKQYLD